MASLNPYHVQAVIKAINQGPFFNHLSMPVKEMGIGYSIVELKVGKEHMNPFGGIHIAHVSSRGFFRVEALMNKVSVKDNGDGTLKIGSKRDFS